MQDLTKNIVLLAAVLALSIVSCQRLHEPTSGGGQPKDQPSYDSKYINTDPNQSGDKN